jgi:hypothetical protein
MIERGLVWVFLIDFLDHTSTKKLLDTKQLLKLANTILTLIIIKPFK